MSFGNLEWLFPIVVTLHNAEEAIWLPGWSKRAGRWRLPFSSAAEPQQTSFERVGAAANRTPAAKTTAPRQQRRLLRAGVFRFGVAVLTVLAFAVTWLSARSGKQTVWTYLAFGYMVAVLANVLIPHVAAAVALRSYVPGVVTAVTLNLPVLSLLVVLAVREGYVSGWKAAEYAAGVSGFLLLYVAAVYKLGRAVEG